MDDTPPAAPAPMRLAVAGMVRNEIDLIGPFLRQCAALFDRTYLIDVQSTDGTRAALERHRAAHGGIDLFTTDRQERFQGAMMDALSRRAFADGADWVFFLDADEFIDVPSRAAFAAALRGFNADVMHLRWINLVPTRYGSFGAFDAGQRFHWSGRASAYHKVAISQLFASNNPGYYIHEGNHHVSPRRDAAEVVASYGPPLLHLPIRSAARLKYKNSAALRVTSSKHNRLAGEGAHIERLERMLATDVADAELNYLAAHYSEPIEQRGLLDPEACGWPSRALPPTIDGPETIAGAETIAGDVTLAETLQRDAALGWDRMAFAPHSIVAAVIEGEVVRVRPQPISGRSWLPPPRFAALPPQAADARSPATVLADAVGIAFDPPPNFTEWNRPALVPAIMATVAASRPRRFVELGVGPGGSFLRACRAAAALGFATECIAIDPWLEDRDAGPHGDPAFETFKAHLAHLFPDQLFIQNRFEAALTCFDDGSIDLLHIGEPATHAAAAALFAQWRPKLSAAGLALLSGIEAGAAGADAWRAWDEIAARHVACRVLRGPPGLGLLCLGAADTPVAGAVRALAADPAGGTVLPALLGRASALLAAHDALVRESTSRLAHLEAETARLQAQVAASDARAHASAVQVEQLEAQLAAILGSTAWRLTSPMRKAGTWAPLLRRATRGRTGE